MNAPTIQTTFSNPYPTRFRVLLLLTGALQLLAPAIVGCSGSETSESNDSEPESGGEQQGLLLDYTAYLEGAIQVSGLAVDREANRIALVTDFERAAIYRLADQQMVRDFSVQFGDLPRQGASEAIGFGKGGQLVVLYPDHRSLVAYDDQGERVNEITLPEGEWFGAMTIDPRTNSAYLVRGIDGSPELVTFDLEEETMIANVELTGDLVGKNVHGLSLDFDGGTETLWAVGGTSQAFTITTDNGETAVVGQANDVADGSAIEAFINQVEDEPENALAISDDDDAYNSEPGPLRLYLIEEPVR